MQIQVETTAWTAAAADWLVIPVAESAEAGAGLKTLDESLGGQIQRLGESGDLKGKLAELLAVHDVPQIAADRLLFVGVGKGGELDAGRLNKAMMTVARKISDKQETRVAVALPELDGSVSAAQVIAVALSVGCVGQDLYRSEQNRFPFPQATLLADSAADVSELQAAADRGGILGEAINLTRELVNRPAEDIYPESFAERAQQTAADCGLVIDILDEDRLEEEKMGSLLAVARGSDRPPRVVVLEHRGGGEGAPTLGIVGKGVTFDSGGLSLKTNDGMKTMKSDMAGAATMLGAMSAIARLNLPVNVVGIAGLVENMVSGNSYKLGDVLTARNGTTIEVLNTDAEGRLVLADVLNYAVDRGADKLIDLATLTSACVVALGEDVTGAFANDGEWCDSVISAAKRSCENIWQMPMFDFFAEQLKSDVADCKNVGTRWGGSITAAKFLEKFVEKKPWVHLDIAGPSFAGSNNSHREGGATGCMVRTLVEVAASFRR